MRGLAPATRVMSRNDPPTAASGSWPSTLPAPAWLTSTFASACGRWLVSATSRSWASGSIATGRAPSEDTKVCSRRCADGSVSATGVRNQVAPSNSSGRALATPRASDPHTGWPPTNCGLAPTCATNRPLVDPTSDTAHPDGAASSAWPVSDASSATGPHTNARSAPSSAPPMVGSKRAIAPRSRPISPAASSGSVATTWSPRAVAASASEPPIRPSPITATLMAGAGRRAPRPRASARPRGRPDPATGGRSGGGRRAWRSCGRGGPRAPPPSRPGTP